MINIAYTMAKNQSSQGNPLIINSQNSVGNESVFCLVIQKGKIEQSGWIPWTSQGTHDGLVALSCDDSNSSSDFIRKFIKYYNNIF